MFHLEFFPRVLPRSVYEWFHLELSNRSSIQNHFCVSLGSIKVVPPLFFHQLCLLTQHSNTLTFQGFPVKSVFCSQGLSPYTEVYFTCSLLIQVIFKNLSPEVDFQKHRVLGKTSSKRTLFRPVCVLSMSLCEDQKVQHPHIFNIHIIKLSFSNTSDLFSGLLSSVPQKPGMDMADTYITFIRQNQDILRDRINEELYIERVFDVSIFWGGGVCRHIYLSVNSP